MMYLEACKHLIGPYARKFWSPAKWRIGAGGAKLRILARATRTEVL